MARWRYGGDGDLFPDLTWTNRPDMTGSEAPQFLQDAWTAVFLAIKDVLGAAKNGGCFLINMTAGPLVQEVLGEPVAPCAGYAAFIERNARIEFGMRWRPEKWSRWIDASAGAHVRPVQDIHVWLETHTHVIDFTTGDSMEGGSFSWPPLIYRQKSCFPKHPREAREPGSILLWRNAKALRAIAEMTPLIPPLASRAFEIYAKRSRGTRHDKEKSQAAAPVLPCGA
jgi:hypothetical protein